MILKKELEEIERSIAHSDKKAEKVSKVGIDWHLNHALTVVINVCKVLHKSDPKTYKWKFSLSKTYIMTRGSIPRGAGRAPKSVAVEAPLTQSELQAQLQLTRELLTSMEKLENGVCFEHPYFGWMKKKKTERFLWIHTEHHLKIVRDILKEKS